MKAALAAMVLAEGGLHARLAATLLPTRRGWRGRRSCKITACARGPRVLRGHGRRCLAVRAWVWRTGVALPRPPRRWAAASDSSRSLLRLAAAVPCC